MLSGGLLVQERPAAMGAYETWQVVTRRAPTDGERDDLLFAWRAVATVKSNAIVLVRDGATIGIGAGQNVARRCVVPRRAQGAGRGPRHIWRGAGFGCVLSLPRRRRSGGRSGHFRHRATRWLRSRRGGDRGRGRARDGNGVHGAEAVSH